MSSAITLSRHGRALLVLALGVALSAVACGERIELGSDDLPTVRPPGPGTPSPLCAGAPCGAPCPLEPPPPCTTEGCPPSVPLTGQCDGAGRCVEEVSCAELDACEGKICGESCSLCLASGAGCPVPQPFPQVPPEPPRVCDALGRCVLADPQQVCPPTT